MLQFLYDIACIIAMVLILFVIITAILLVVGLSAYFAFHILNSLTGGLMFNG